MRPVLHRIDFSEDLLDAVQDFECGAQPWERYLSEWISNRDGALADMAELGCRVWLYADDARRLIGFGSFGVMDNWRVPNPKKSPHAPVSVIPAIAVATAYQSKPVGVPREHRYARVILEDLIAEAFNYVEERPFLGLFVHVDNHRAAAFYRGAGFRDHGKPFLQKTTEQMHQKMVYDLRTRRAP